MLGGAIASFEPSLKYSPGLMGYPNLYELKYY